MAFLAPLAAPLLEAGGAEAAGGLAGEAGGGAGLLGGLGGFMGDHPFMMGNLMGRAMSGGGDGQAMMGPSAGASVAEPMVGVTGRVGADMFGEEDTVGLGSENRGENSDPDQQSSSGADVKERGDSPEQLKDVNMSGTGGDGRGGTQDSNAMDNLSQEGGGDTELRDTASNAFHSNLPLVLEFAFSDQSGADHPILKALDELLESAYPGYKETEPMATEGGVDPHDPENPTEKLEGDLGQDLDSDGPADTPESKEEDEEPSKRESKRIAREAGYCWQCWGPLDVLQRCASCVTSEVYTGENPPPGPWEVGHRVRHVDSINSPENYSTIVKRKRTPYGHAYDLQSPDGEVIPDVPHNSDLAYVDAGKPEPNYFPPTGPNTFNKFPNIEAGDVQHFDPKYFERRLKNRGARNAASVFADVPGPPSATGMGYAQDTGAMTNITGIPTCPLCHQNHVAGTPCPTPQMQAPTPTTQDQISPAAQNFGVPLQNNKVVTKFVQVHVAEYNADEIDREPVDPMHNESYEDGEKPDTGWYEDWQGDDKGGDEKHPWVDDKGEPLRDGVEYEMHSTGYAIPDKIKVLAVTPNKLTYELEAGDLAYKDTITTDDVYKQGYTFQPSSGDDDPGMEAQPEKRSPYETGAHPMPPRPGDDALPQQDDISSPPTRVSSEGPYGGKLHPGTCDFCGDQEQGVYKTIFGAQCPTCAHSEANQLPEMSSEPYAGDPTRHSSHDPGDEDEGHVYLGSYRGDDPDSRNWLNDPGPGQGVDIDPAMMAKLAGKEYSPREQRQFVEESGTARNLHRLNLEGTHYELDDYGDSLW